MDGALWFEHSELIIECLGLWIKDYDWRKHRVLQIEERVLWIDDRLLRMENSVFYIEDWILRIKNKED